VNFSVSLIVPAWLALKPGNLCYFSILFVPKAYIVRESRRKYIAPLPGQSHRLLRVRPPVIGAGRYANVSVNRRLLPSVDAKLLCRIHPHLD